MIDVNKRKYIAISIKHSQRGLQNCPSEPKVGRYTLWGTKRTEDNGERCFAGYTDDFKTCELYSLADFQNSYGNGDIKCDEPVTMVAQLCRRWKNKDTVLVDADEYQYCFETFNPPKEARP